jgi:hypothetical protein
VEEGRDAGALVRARSTPGSRPEERFVERMARRLRQRPDRPEAPDAYRTAEKRLNLFGKCGV